MKTDNSLSTVTYISCDTLKLKLQALVLQKIIGKYAFILHNGEDSEKNHIHVYFEPLCKIDTDKLREEWQEYPVGTCSLNECLSFENVGTMRIQKSDFDNWLLYVLHDFNYLLMKREHKQYSYELHDIVSNFDITDNMLKSAQDKLLYSDEMKILDYIERGGEPKQLLLLGYDMRTICQVLDFLKKSSPYYLQHKDYERLVSIRKSLKDIKLPVDIV